MTPVLVFDIETIPDVGGLRLLHNLESDIPDAEVVEMAFQQRRQTTGSDFLPLYLQRIIAISCVLRERDNLTVWSLGTNQDNEEELIRRFFEGIEKYTPQLVSWNGGGFDLPVLHYRALIHKICASRYWEMGDEDREFKWNNYISRYHTRHLDLMDLLALYQPRASAPLDQFAKLMGFPGKLGMDGSQVWFAFQNGQLDDIRNYCETDVMNTYLVFLRFELMRGTLTEGQYKKECDLIRSTLSQYMQAHWRDFLSQWNNAS